MSTRRHSRKRDKILDVLWQGGALSAAELHRRIPEINLTTVYRNLELFVKDGTVKKLNLGNDEASYEYTKDHHHHAICSNCDRIIHFHAPSDKLKKLIALEGFEADTIEITVRGTCDNKH